MRIINAALHTHTHTARWLNMRVNSRSTEFLVPKQDYAYVQPSSPRSRRRTWL